MQIINFVNMAYFALWQVLKSVWQVLEFLWWHAVMLSGHSWPHDSHVTVTWQSRDSDRSEYTIAHYTTSLETCKFIRPMRSQNPGQVITQDWSETSIHPCIAWLHALGTWLEDQAGLLINYRITKTIKETSTTSALAPKEFPFGSVSLVSSL